MAVTHLDNAIDLHTWRAAVGFCVFAYKTSNTLWRVKTNYQEQITTIIELICDRVFNHSFYHHLVIISHLTT
ncbi:hypothetical protein BpHYR1_022712 [Brachionus plicatilis]|uniref:Uncharacterized protein n=1 Tax=Brachionus plicatilis TaxID=10195 RepID=A0A3M7T6T7_BRAPC|nr:hypothetical protein BpHYR1_022712 [Brachionus plicatilis]